MKIMDCVKWAVLVAVAAVLGASAQDAMALPTASAMARVSKKVAPDFPAAAKQLNVTGQSEVAIVVSAQGDVEEAKVLRGNAIFSQASMMAVKQWKFTPMVKDGAAVRFSTVIIFNYQK